MSNKIIVKGTLYNFKFFLYQSGRTGIMLINPETGKDYISATLDIGSVKVMENEIIVKNHDLNHGVLEALTEAKLIDKQQKPIMLGYNAVYICKLNKR